jgi:hypothetical protein
MMDMMGAIGGIAGGVLGYMGAMEQADAQRDATRANMDFNYANMAMRERERQEAIAMAKKLQAEQKLGYTDARGMRTKFVPGQGWVSTPSDTMKRLFELQEAEQLNVLTKDLPMARAVRERNYKRGLGEEAIADTYRRKLANLEATPARGDDAYANDLYTAQTRGLQDAERSAGKRMFQQMFRTGAGSSNIAAAAGEMQDKTNRAYANAALQSKLMARGMGAKEKNEQRMPLANLYNLFATRAGQGAEAAYKPQDPLAGDQTALASRNALTAGQDLTKMFAMKGGEFDYVQPNLGYGNALAGLGSSISSAFGAMGAKNKYDQRGTGPGGGGQVAGFGATGGSSNSGMYLDNQSYGWTGD